MGFMPWNVKIPIYRDFTDFTQIYSNFTTLQKFYTGFTYGNGLILHFNVTIITISKITYMECKVYEKKMGKRGGRRRGDWVSACRLCIRKTRASGWIGQAWSD